MAWSTQQLAEVAGATEKAVRHYHRIGLLEMPERLSNGYKQYQARHLVRLLQITRLRDIGVPLARIAETDWDDETSASTVEDLDTELAATVARLNEVRRDLAKILRHRAPAYLPPVFASLARAGTKKPDQSMLLVYSRLLSERSMAQLLDAMSAGPHPLDDEFDDLPDDATDEMVESLSRRLVPVARAMRERALTADAPGGAARADAVLAAAAEELYRPAQVRVIRRVRELTSPSSETRVLSRR